METEIQELCPLCGSVGQIKYDDLHDRLFGAVGSWQMKICNNKDCEVLWLSRRPKESEIGMAYRNYYTHQEDQRRSIVARALRLIQSALVHLILLLTGSLREKKQLDSLFLDELPPGKLLEIGCGSGEFLVKMKQKGWDAQGVDFDDKAAQSALTKYGLVVHTQPLQELRFAANSFHVVALRHVFEHLYEPEKFLKEIYRILKPGGRLIVVTPNGKSWAHSVYSENWRGLEPPRHIVIYNTKAIVSLVENQGFKVEMSFCSAVNSWIVISESKELLDVESGVRKYNQPRIKNILKSLLIWPFVLFRNNFFKIGGDELIIVANNNLNPFSNIK